MAHLPYFNYKGFGEMASEKYWYSQAVRIGDRIECSGQGKSPTSQKPLDSPNILTLFPYMIRSLSLSSLIC